VTRTFFDFLGWWVSNSDVSGQRAKNKVSIGAYVDIGTDAGIQEWLRRNPALTKTDFLMLAVNEKLALEGIPVPVATNTSHSRLRRLPETTVVAAPIKAVEAASLNEVRGAYEAQARAVAQGAVPADQPPPGAAAPAPPPGVASAPAKVVYPRLSGGSRSGGKRRKS
jgi:hypothetical protein